MRKVSITGTKFSLPLLFAGMAHAVTTYDITIGNAAVAPYKKPYAIAAVTLNEDGTAATVTVTAAPGYKIGDGSSVFLNTATPAQITSVTGDVPPINPNQDLFTINNPTENKPTQNVSDFGDASNTIDTFDGEAPGPDYHYLYINTNFRVLL